MASKPKRVLKAARARLTPWLVPLALLAAWQAAAQWGWLS
ncbi:ABC transporter permease, partial [Ralstonia pseudosolanacearum]